MVSLPAQDRSAFPPSAVDAEWAAPALAALLIYAVVVFAPQVLNDADTWWHLAAGRWMLDHRGILRVDVFSYTHAGKPWHAHEWLSEVAMALAYRAAGWTGVVLLFGCAAAAAMALVTRRAARQLPPLTLTVALALMVACMAPGLLARPHLLALPVVVIWMDALLAAREADRAPPLLLSGVMALWANMHGGHVLGLGLIAPFALEAVSAAPPERRLAVFRGWAAFALASLAASLATPFGVAGLLYPIELVRLKFLPEIVEWRPQDFSKIGTFEIALMASLFVMLQRGVRIPTLRLAILLGLVDMALHQSRHQFLLGPLALMLLAEPIGRAVAPDAPRARQAVAGQGWIAACAALALLLAGVRLAFPVERLNGPRAPIQALMHAPAALRAQPVFNDYGFGGYLIFEGVRPFIDGRSDMYGEAFSSAFFRAERPDPAALDRLLTQWQVSWTLLSFGDPVTEMMDRRPGWRRLYADRYAVIHVRDGALPPSP